MKVSKQEELLRELDKSVFKTQIRLNAINRCFPKDAVGAEMECWLHYLCLIKEASFMQPSLLEQEPDDQKAVDPASAFESIERLEFAERDDAQ